MSLRILESGHYSLYDASRDALYHETEIAFICYCCGLNGSNPLSYTIDEILDAITSTYPDILTPFGGDNNFVPSSSSFLVKQHMLLAMYVKRVYRYAHLARLRTQNA